LLTINYYELDEFIDFCKSLKVRFSISMQIIPDLLGNQDPIEYRLDPQKAADRLKKSGLDLKTVYGEPHICDAGDNVYIDANKILRGCPVLKTDYDLAMKEGYDSRLIFSTMDKIRAFCNNFNDKVCPGWMLLEDREKVKSYINTVENCMKG
jgi:hypothetical protein